MLSYLAQSETGQNPLIPALPEFIIGTIVFVVVFGVLAKLLMPRIQQTLSERTEMIEGGLARSDEAQAEAKQLLDQYREQLAGARHEAARLREEAREQGAQIIAEMREQAQAEARRVTEGAQAQIEAERQQALTRAAGRGRDAGDRAGQPDRGRVAHRRGAAEPDGGQVPDRARGVQLVRRASGSRAVTTARSDQISEVRTGGDERARCE